MTIEDANVVIVVNEPETIIENYLREELGITKYEELSVNFTDNVAYVTIPSPEQLNLPIENSDTEDDPPFVADAPAVDTEGFFKK